jgi:hypothetical protein
MKAAALRHLLLLCAQGISEALDEGDRRRLAEVVRTLRVTSERGSFRLAYDLDNESRQITVPSRRFDFYRRGDVASQNARRPAGLDLRTTNWEAAQQTWAEILQRDELAEFSIVRALVPRSGPVGGLSLPLGQVGLAVVAAAPAVASGRWRQACAALVAGAATVAAGEPTRSAAGIAVVASLMTATTVGAPTVPSLAGSAATVVGASGLDGRPGELVESVATVASAGIGGGWAAANAVAALSDVVQGAVGGDRRLTTRGAAMAAVALAGAARARPSGSRTSVPIAVAVGTVACCLAGETVLRSMEGTRRRLRPLTLPIGIALASAWKRDRPSAIALGVGWLAASLTARARRRVSGFASTPLDDRQATPAHEVPVMIKGVRRAQDVDHLVESR